MLKPYELPIVEPVDLRKICFGSAYVTATVRMDQQFDWLVLGQIALLRSDTRNTWTLSARLPNATDFDHSSVYALKLDLVGVELDMIAYGQTIVRGWIRADDAEKFRVPISSAYDPRIADISSGRVRKLCSLPECNAVNKQHFIIPDEYYVPKHDAALYERVRGCRVEIRVMSVVKED